MGVEYSRGLFVEDLGFKPTWNTLEAVHRVLAKWNLGSATTYELYDVDNAMAAITAKAAQKQLPPNLLSMYSVDGEVAAKVMGESQYGLGDDTRYLTVMVVLGVDFHVVCNEDYEITVTTAPKNGKKAVGRGDLQHGHHWRYPATWDTTPPKTDAKRGQWSGVWRSAIILDCGKDLPACSDGSALPAKGFRSALEKALGTTLIESGWHH